mmetsp:Transcript_3046/g.9500  ORF Transcript_3046/g.9500 Transcript_3046/m.9500 type:complete len:210 (+) Transcript_3046:361-990(+)
MPAALRPPRTAVAAASMRGARRLVGRRRRPSMPNAMARTALSMTALGWRCGVRTTSSPTAPLAAHPAALTDRRTPVARVAPSGSSAPRLSVAAARSAASAGARLAPRAYCPSCARAAKAGCLVRSSPTPRRRRWRRRARQERRSARRGGNGRPTRGSFWTCPSTGARRRGWSLCCMPRRRRARLRTFAQCARERRGVSSPFPACDSTAS